MCSVTSGNNRVLKVCQVWAIASYLRLVCIRCPHKTRFSRNQDSEAQLADPNTSTSTNCCHKPCRLAVTISLHCDALMAHIDVLCGRNGVQRFIRVYDHSTFLSLQSTPALAPAVFCSCLYFSINLPRASPHSPASLSHTLLAHRPSTHPLEFCVCLGREYSGRATNKHGLL